MNFKKLYELIDSGDQSDLNQFMDENDLIIKDGKIYHKSPQVVKQQIAFWDKRQLIRKINLNSLYGALLNPYCRFFDERVGQSTTLCGRLISKHMASHINQSIEGEYAHNGRSIIYGDTDSETGDTIHETNWGQHTIEELFNRGSRYWADKLKEYSTNDDLKVLSYNPDTNESYLSPINYIYRHKVSKEQWEIEDEFGNKIRVTGDHSVMIERNNELIEIKPRDILADDVLITALINNETKHKNVQSVKQLTDFDNEYVYDIGIKSDNQYFFGNNILIHNSSYFTAYPALKDEIDSGELDWNKEFVINLYDTIAKETNESFPAFMAKAFNCPSELGEIIVAGREMVAETGLFITKKRYATLMYELEGERLDVSGSRGKVKAMGMDLKRSDTPVDMQDFLKEILEDLLTGSKEHEIMDKVKEFKIQFTTKDSWEKGSPKRVNKLLSYTAQEEAKGKSTMPGHTRAAMNWNNLCKMNNDNHSMRIYDGQKTIVCKMRNNPLGYTSVAYPIDEQRLPDWFKELPFDDKAMEAAIIDKKVMNLLHVLNWDLAKGISNNTFNKLFDFTA